MTTPTNKPAFTAARQLAADTPGTYAVTGRLNLRLQDGADDIGGHPFSGPIIRRVANAECALVHAAQGGQVSPIDTTIGVISPGGRMHYQEGESASDRRPNQVFTPYTQRLDSTVTLHGIAVLTAPGSFVIGCRSERGHPGKDRPIITMLNASLTALALNGATVKP